MKSSNKHHTPVTVSDNTIPYFVYTSKNYAVPSPEYITRSLPPIEDSPIPGSRAWHFLRMDTSTYYDIRFDRYRTRRLRSMHGQWVFWDITLGTKFLDLLFINLIFSAIVCMLLKWGAMVSLEHEKLPNAGSDFKRLIMAGATREEILNKGREVGYNGGDYYHVDYNNINQNAWVGNWMGV